LEPAGSCQDAHEPDNVGANRLRAKRVFRLEANEIAGVADHNLSVEWQLPKQLSTELCSRSRLADDERARSTHIDDIEAAQFSCQHGWEKCPVSADVDTSQKKNERRSAHQTSCWRDSVEAPGSRQRNVAPPPVLFSARIDPPCAVTIERLIARPRPRPCS